MLIYTDPDGLTVHAGEEKPGIEHELHVNKQIMHLAFRHGKEELGLTNEALVTILMNRLSHLQRLAPCLENTKAWKALEEAMEAFNHREARLRGEKTRDMLASAGSKVTMPAEYVFPFIPAPYPKKHHFCPMETEEEMAKQRTIGAQPVCGGPLTTKEMEDHEQRIKEAIKKIKPMGAAHDSAKPYRVEYQISRDIVPIPVGEIVDTDKKDT